MKTLDEVVEILENVVKHNYVWFDEKTALMTIETLTDTLQYLKEYKRISAKLEKIAFGNITETLEKLDNPALTWDELRQMEGKPVWIWLSPRIKNTPGSGRWEIIYKFNPIGGNKNLFEMEMESRSRFKRKYQGDLWQAYRKEK